MLHGGDLAPLPFRVQCHNESVKFSERRLVDILLVVAVVIVITQRTLRSVLELFTGGAVLGDILTALRLSYVGAWLFNLLVIRLPKRRDKTAVLSISGNLVA
jgi:hypothetical protein